MANVRGIADFQGPANPQQGRAAASNPQGGPNNIFMMTGNESSGGSMYPPINKVLAPNYTAKSFIFVISILQLCLFVVELIVGATVEDGAFVEGNDMAGPSSATLKIMGAKYLPCIQDGEIYRFLTPALLHSGILHLFTNMVSQTMIGYTCELHWGTKRMMMFYFGTAFGATLMSCVGAPQSVSVGASGSLLGIIGAYMAWILLNWNNRDLLPQPCPRMCTMITWLFIILMVGMSMQGIDNFAHGGGWLTGMIMGFAFNPSSAPIGWIDKRYHAIKISFKMLTFIYFAAMVGCTFLVVSAGPMSQCWG